MDKRGFLLGEETLKVILAVICIIFLVYLLGSLYYNSVKNKEVGLAKASVEHLVKEINAGSTEIEIYNPEGWVIGNFPDDKDYICICETILTCDPDETCKKTKEPITLSPFIDILNPPITLELNGNVLSKKIEVEE